MKRPDTTSRRSMGIILTFVFNSALNLVLGLAVAAVLGPEEYGRFAIAFMLSIVLSTALFDWLRLAATRFFAEAGRPSGAIKTSIEGGYGVIGASLLLLLPATHFAGMVVDAAGVSLLLVAVTAIANARFEFRAAEARAFFLDGVYIRLVLAKNLLALVLMLGAGYFFREASWVMAALASSSVVASLAAGRKLDRVRVAKGRLELSLLKGFARYGIPIVGANLLYQIAVLANRSFGAKWFGLADAGTLSLATDLTIRLLISAGAALDAYLFQIAVRRRSSEGEAGARRQVADNMLVIGGILAVLAVGYVATLPSLEALFVPAAYRGSFAALSLILMPGVYLFCFVQFGVSPIFQLSRSTAPLFWTACLGLGLDLALLLLARPPAAVSGIATIHMVALVVGALAAILWATRTRDCWPPAREALKVGLLVLSVAAAMWPFRWLDPSWLSLLGACAAGGFVAAAMPLVLDVMGIRSLLRRRLPGRCRPDDMKVSPIGE